MINEYEEEKEGRQEYGVFDLVAVAFRYSQSRVHDNYFIPILNVTKLEMLLFSHKYRAIFPPNKDSITFL